VKKVESCYDISKELIINGDDPMQELMLPKKSESYLIEKDFSKISKRSSYVDSYENEENIDIEAEKSNPCLKIGALLKSCCCILFGKSFKAESATLASSESKLQKI